MEGLLRIGRRHPYVGLTDPDAIRENLVHRSLLVRSLLVEGRSLLDAGTGVGIPGLPLGLLTPARPLFLVEPRSACVGLLHWLNQRLPPLNCRTLTCRLQEVEFYRLPRLQLVTRAALDPSTLASSLPATLFPWVRWTSPETPSPDPPTSRTGWVHRRIQVHHESTSQSFDWWGPDALFHVKQNHWSHSPDVEVLS